MAGELSHIRCIKEACRCLRIPVKTRDKNGNLLDVGISGGLFFANFATPWNSGSVDQVCKDKEFTYFLLKDVMPMPKTQGFFDPDYPREDYRHYKNFRDTGRIAEEIEKKSDCPIIVKKNSGTRGVNVFLCQGVVDIEKALNKIFSKDSVDYDYIALAQEYIKSKIEYRVITFKGKVVLTYRKNNDGARFVGNLSPLHFEGSRAEIEENKEVIADLENFIRPVFVRIPLVFGGFDIILDEDDKLWLIEINSRPGFNVFVRDNGEEPLIKMYEKIFKSLF